MKEVPDNVDLLIAGTSCVDFSPLNGNKLKLDDFGESGATFFAALQYMKIARPKIVIFENVLSAPWTTKKDRKGNETIGMDVHVNKIAYASQNVILDTKDFYLPHTRCRGYMICIDMENAYATLCPEPNPDPTDEEIRTFGTSQSMTDMFTDWVVLVKKLGCKASVPVDSMLLSADDAHVVGMRDSEREEKPRGTTPWEKCRVGHKNYRSEKRLGTQHVITDWVDGSYRLPDHFKQGIRGLTQRVCDTIDIAHLRNVSRDFDDRFYR